MTTEQKLKIRDAQHKLNQGKEQLQQALLQLNQTFNETVIAVVKDAGHDPAKVNINLDTLEVVPV